MYGSFEKGYAIQSARAIHELAPEGSECPLVVHEPVAADAFDFNSLKDTQYLVLCVSSQNGFPPLNFVDFAHQLLLAAETGEEDCMAHLQHAVWGEGDPRWRKTFMNVPRYMDLLLEECGLGLNAAPERPVLPAISQKF